LFPKSVYTVSVSTATFRTKVSVGSNPWAPREPKHNLATICERYGGGGHPRVGAISFEPGEVARARQAAAEIVEELRRDNYDWCGLAPNICLPHRAPMTISPIILHWVRIPLLEPFRISNGSVAVKDSIIVEVHAGHLTGFGEASPMAGSFYSPETPEST